MYELNFPNWKQFKSDFIQELHKSTLNVNLSNFLFRGQGDASWRLWSSFDRIEKNKSKYPLLLKNFKIICNYYNYNDELFLEKDEVIAAYAQHYGLPTRLLDWTESPYFAAFFAFSSALSLKTKITKCSIWAINKDSVALQQKGGIDFISLPSNKFNYRMRNQIGHFTLSSHTEDSLEEFDTTIKGSTGIDDLLWKFNISLPKDITSLITDLDLMGIDYCSVYPDIQGYIEKAIFKSGITKV